MLVEKGAKVVIGDSPGQLYNAAILNHVYSVCGLKAAEEAGAELNRNFEQHSILFPEAKVAKSFSVTSYLTEADAVISKRSENVERSVDKMENSIQNIILQEMENLEGILIATTNLTKNLDSAFERRFLYKIEFAKPSLEAKQAIWQAMLPSLSDADAAVLATKYDFSGGQIENVVRKESVEEILTGNIADINRLMEFCNEERLDGGHSNRRIGF
jgi:AAA+ superfamily predicted ATPase